MSNEKTKVDLKRHGHNFELTKFNDAKLETNYTLGLTKSLHILNMIFLAVNYMYYLVQKNFKSEYFST